MTLTRFTKIAALAVGLAFAGYSLMPSLDNVAKVRQLLDLAMPLETEGGEARLQALSSIPDAARIIYPAQGAHRRTLMVLSDPTCPHCQSFHGEIPSLNEHGWEVQVLLAPRGGTQGEYWPASQSIWCARDRKAALEAHMAKTGDVPAAPVSECDTGGLLAIVTAAEQLGIERRPYLVLDDGTGIKGAVPADALEQFNPTTKSEH